MSQTLLHDPETHRLGKKDATPPHAMLSDFVDLERVQAEDPPPANIVNSTGPNGQLPLAMYLNDQYSDCTCAGVGNILRVDSDDAKTITDQDVLVAYEAVTAKEGAAFSPGPPPVNDNGCNEVDVLDYWASTGIGGDVLLGHAGVDYTNQAERRLALWLCGPLYPGWALSTDQQSQTIWAPGTAAAGSWGGHAAPISDDYTDLAVVGYVIAGVPIPRDIEEILLLMTWGGYKPARGSYVPFACDELHALITDAWLARNESNPAVDVAKLKTYLATLKQES